MLVPMTKVRILGRRGEVERVVGRAPPARPRGARGRAHRAVTGRAGRRRQARSARSEELRLSLAQTDELLGDLRASRARRVPRPAGAAAGSRRAASGARSLAAASRTSDRRLDALRDEGWLLPGFLEPLRLLLPLVPELADLDDEELAPARLGYGRARAQHRRRAARRDAPRRARRAARRPLRAGLDAHRAGGDRLPRRVSAPTSGTPSALLGARAGSPAPRCPSVQGPLAARGRRGDGAPARGASPRLIAAVERNATRHCCSRTPSWLGPPHAATRRRARAARRGRASSARRSARSSPSAGFPGARWRGCDASSARARAPPSSSRTWRPPRVTRRRRC